MEKQSQKSLLDILFQIMPDWRNQITEIRVHHNPASTKAAKALFALWKDDRNVVEKNVLKCPADVSFDDIKAMQQDGLVRNLGEKVEITAKGAEVIKTMILGDEKSAFDDDGSILPYEKAYANTKVRTRTAKKLSAKVEDRGNWYQRLK